MSSGESSAKPAAYSPSVSSGWPCRILTSWNASTWHEAIGRIGEIGTEYNRETIFLTDRECRLLNVLRRLDEPRQERIVAFAEDLAGACDTTLAGRQKKESS